MMNKGTLKEKLLTVVEVRLEELGYKQDEIMDMDLDNLTIGELILTAIGAYYELQQEETSVKYEGIVEYHLKDKDIKLIKSIQLKEEEIHDKQGIKYFQISFL